MPRTKNISIVLSAIGLALFLILFVNLDSNIEGKPAIYQAGGGIIYFGLVFGVLLFKFKNDHKIFQRTMFALAALPFIVAIIIFFVLSGTHA
jgi:hypothetical protein